MENKQNDVKQNGDGYTLSIGFQNAMSLRTRTPQYVHRIW